MPLILPLPNHRRDGKCPWCEVSILRSEYGENIPHGDLEMDGCGKCPKCDMPIRVDFEEVITHTVRIEAERTPVDKRYMEHMGLKEPQP